MVEAPSGNGREEHGEGTGGWEIHVAREGRKDL